MTIPADMRYAKNHEWLRIDGDIAAVGITVAYAAEAMADIVFITLPATGETVGPGRSCGEVETTKSVSHLNAPVGEEVTEIDEAPAEDFGVPTSDPYGAGRPLRIRTARPAAGLLDATAYSALTEGA